MVGTAASVVGLFLGLGLAKLLFWLFDLVGFTLPNSGLLFETRTIVVSLLGRDHRDAAREPASGHPRDARAPDRRRPRGGDAAAVALRPLPHRRLARDHRARLRRAPLRALRQRARDDADPALDGRWRAPRSSSASRSSPPGSSPAGGPQRPSGEVGARRCRAPLLPLRPRDLACPPLAARRRQGACASASRDRARGRARCRAGRNPFRRALTGRFALDLPARRCRDGRRECARRLRDLAQCTREGRAGLADRPTPGPGLDRARRGQRAAQPAADRLDRVGADDRPGARHARRDARRRDHEHLPRRGRQDLHLRLRDHGAEQLLADPDRRRRGGREDPRRRGDREHPLRRGPRLRLDRVRDRRRPERGRGDHARLGGGLAGRLPRARRRRRVRRRRLRQGSRAQRRLADHRHRSLRQAARADREGHLRPAGRRLAVRRRHLLERDLRRGLRLAAQPLHVHPDERRRDRGRTRRRSRRRSARSSRTRRCRPATSSSTTRSPPSTRS